MTYWVNCDGKKKKEEIFPKKTKAVSPQEYLYYILITHKAIHFSLREEIFYLLLIELQDGFPNVFVHSN